MLKELTFEKFKYILYEPNLEEKENLPLITVLHGSGEIGNKLSKLRAREPYLSLKKGTIIPNAYILMPLLPSGSWTKFSDQLKKLIDQIINEYDCDINRISITGHSLGGAGVIDMLLKYPNYFAAAASLSPCVNYKNDLEKITHIPIWFFYGEKESTYGKYAQEMYKKLEALNGDSILTCVKNKGHTIQSCWCDNQYDLFNWLAAYHLNMSYPTWNDYLHGIDLKKPIPAKIARKLGLKPLNYESV